MAGYVVRPEARALVAQALRLAARKFRDDLIAFSNSLTDLSHAGGPDAVAAKVRECERIADELEKDD